MEEKVLNEVRAPKLWEALTVLVLLIAAISVGIIVYGCDPHVPMFIGVVFAVLMAFRLGYKWDCIEKFMIDGVSKAMQSIMILLIIGILIGIWLDSGVVPTMIFYGLKILHPSIFYVSALLICSITSLATGTSWGTMGTMGVAMMGIAFGLGMDAGVTAGAVISGAYFGDKMSPLSDTTNLAPGMAGTDVMTHVKFMLKPTAFAYGASLLFFAVMGFVQYKGGAADMSTVDTLINTLGGMFNINPLLLLPPVIVIVAIALKVPALPGIFLGIMSGGILGIILQPDCNLGTLFTCGMSGFSCETGIYEIDRLLNSGGIDGMMYSISMTIIAMMFGGVMESTGQLAVIVDKLKKLATTPAKLVLLTELTCIGSNATMPEQYISIVVPGRMYAEEYEKMGLHACTLSNALEGAGTVSSALIPWNTCGVFILGTLGVGVAEYGVYAVFNWLMPIVLAVMAFTGHCIAYKDENGKPITATKLAKLQPAAEASAEESNVQ